MILKKGSKDKAKVTELKAKLAKVGYLLSDAGASKGVFGAKVQAAVISFQKSQSLLDDGEVGPLTMAALDAKISGLKVEADSPVKVTHEDFPYLVWAERNVGQKEIPGNKSNPFIVDLFKYTSLKGTAMALNETTAWCAAFVCAGLGKNGYKNVNSASARECEKIGVATTPQRGAIATIKRSGGSGRHVFFISSVNEKAGTCKGCGGNQSDSVSIVTYKISALASCRMPVKA